MIVKTSARSEDFLPNLNLQNVEASEEVAVREGLKDASIFLAVFEEVHSIMAAAVPTAMTLVPAKELAQQAWLLLVYLGHLLCKEVEILQPVVYAVLVEVDEGVALARRLLAQIPTKPHPPLRRHPGEDLHGCLQVVVVSRVHLL